MQTKSSKININKRSLKLSKNLSKSQRKTDALKEQEIKLDDNHFSEVDGLISDSSDKPEEDSVSNDDNLNSLIRSDLTKEKPNHSANLSVNQL